MTTSNAQMVELWNSDAAATWSARPERYDAMLAPLGERVISAAALVAGERVLDVGCGAGQLSLQAARMVGPARAVTASDISRGLSRRDRAPSSRSGARAGRGAGSGRAGARLPCGVVRRGDQPLRGDVLRGPGGGLPQLEDVRTTVNPGGARSAAEAADFISEDMFGKMMLDRSDPDARVAAMAALQAAYAERLRDGAVHLEAAGWVVTGRRAS